MASTAAPTQWHKDQFLISTSQALLQHDVINDAFASDYMYWTKRMSEDAMKHMVKKSFCFGVYALPQSSSEIAGRTNPTQIGFARLITDESTFAYLTDVFIIPSYQGKGLGKWLIGCVNEVLETWPDLRAMLLYAGGKKAQAFYAEILAMKPFVSGKNDLEIMVKLGPGDVMGDH